jgi:His/Glu/Gln/Arg/opine family amino acid ABC transporter permease subunit
MSSATPTVSRPLLPAFLRDLRVLQIIGQIIFAALLVLIVSQVWTSILLSLQSKNLTPNLTFLQNRAGFDISEAPTWYSADTSYWTAFQVGVLNTLRVVVIGLVLTTILGVLTGIFLLSSNWLVRNFFRTVVEIIRNIPLLVQLFVWYFIIRLALPVAQQPITLPSEGITLIPWRWFAYAAILFFAWRSVNRLPAGTFRRTFTLYSLLAAFAAIEIAFWLPALRAVYGSGSLGSTGFWIYAIISIAAIVGAWFAPHEVRGLAFGAAVGQFAGGLLFYFGVAPASGLRLELYPAIFMSLRGFNFPELVTTGHFSEWLAFVALGCTLAVAMWYYFGRVIEQTGRPIPRGWYALAAVLGFSVLGWFLVGVGPEPKTIPIQQDDKTVYLSIEDARQQKLLTLDDEALYSRQPLLVVLPTKNNFRFLTGIEITPEYMSLLIGLVVYTAGFIAEIVRAGIMAVPRGQLEAARALGFTTGQTLRMIILPQALRVIIPPLGNQYLNLAKNSSLAIAIGYADLYAISQTIMNQSGQSVTGMTMMMFTYLAMSLTIATLMSRVNQRFQLVTR